MRYLIGATAIAVAAAVYALACLIWPFIACTRCEGSGQHRSPFGWAWRTCRRCHGSGTRLRTGRRVLNHFHGVRD